MADDGLSISQLPHLKGGMQEAVSRNAMIPLAIGTEDNARISAKDISAYILSALSGAAEAADLERLRSDFSSHINNSEIHITQAERVKWNNKQDSIPVPLPINKGGTNGTSARQAVDNLFNFDSLLEYIIGYGIKNGRLEPAFRSLEEFINDSGIYVKRDNLDVTNNATVNGNYASIFWTITENNQILSIDFEKYKTGEYLFVKVIRKSSSTYFTSTIRIRYYGGIGGWTNHVIGSCSASPSRLLIFIRTGSGNNGSLSYLGSFKDE